jgi:hypothetical protein
MELMDQLHSVLRSIRGEHKARPNHFTVFREFLNELERISRERGKRAPAAPARRAATARKGKR